MKAKGQARSGSGGWWQKAGLFVAASALCGLLFEAGLRVAGISYPVFDVYDEVQGIKLRPGKKGWYRKEGEAFLEINSLGYRDVEHELAAPPDVFRIAVLGDSFTEARQMPIEETYWHRLGEALEACPALEGREIEVLSFGIGGYSTAQSMLAYEQDARRFGPDLVLLGLFPSNDIRENSEILFRSNSHRFSPKPFYHLVDDELTLSPPEPLSLMHQLMLEGIDRFRILELVNEARARWRLHRKLANKEKREATVEAGLDSFIFQPAAQTPHLSEAWTLTGRLLAELDRNVRSDGARFMVASIPSAIQTHPDTEYREALAAKLGTDDLLFPERQLATFGKKYGFPAFPMVGEMQTAADGRHFHGFDNTGYGFGHLNPLGNRELADRLAPRICAELEKGEEPAGQEGGLAAIDRG